MLGGSVDVKFKSPVAILPINTHHIYTLRYYSKLFSTIGTCSFKKQSKQMVRP